MTEKVLELLGLPTGAGKDDIIATLTSCRAAVACVQDLGELLRVEANAAAAGTGCHFGVATGRRKGELASAGAGPP